MKKLLAIGIISLLFGTVSANAQQSSVQIIDINIAEMAVINTSGVLSMNFNAVQAGDTPEPVYANTTYSISTNGANKKVTAEIDVDLPVGVTIDVEMQPTPNGTSTGKQRLSTNPVDLVLGVTRERGIALNVSWEGRVTLEAEPGSHTRFVTFTLTNQ